MAFVNCDDAIQQITTTAAYPAFCNSILPRTPQRSADTFDFHRSDCGGDLRPILGITIEDDEPRGRPKWKRFSPLLNDPQAGWVLCDVDMQDPSTVVTDDEEAVEHTERDRWNREEVHRSGTNNPRPRKSQWNAMSIRHPAVTVNRTWMGLRLNPSQVQPRTA